MGAKLQRAALVLALCTALAGLLDGCGGTAGATALSPGPPAASERLTPLPAPTGPLGLPDILNDAAQPQRHLSSEGSYDGVSRLVNSVSGVSPNTNNFQWLVLNGAVGFPAAWAVWRFPESPDGAFQQFTLNMKPSASYYVAFGRFPEARWQFYDLAAHADGLNDSISIDPASLPGGESALHSPGGFAYLAIIAIGHEVQVKSITVKTPTADPPPGTDSIFDQFEPNDSLDTCWPLTPGIYHASIHQTLAQMASGMTRDPIDCYCTEVPAGQTLTLTLRHEAFDHFGSGFASDCDILFYTNPGASSVYNDFDENVSSTGIYYDPFEQVNWTNASGGPVTMKYAIVGDISEPGVRNNDEYDLGVFVSAATQQVNGTITQQGQDLKADVVAFLTPGNFNANTPVPGNGTPGIFSIQGVPPGTYELHVHSSARLSVVGYEWPEKLTGITVVNNEVTGLTLDIGPDPN